MFYPKIARRHVQALQLLTFLVLSSSLARPLHGQVAGATLSGTVTDASGAVVPQAQVSIKAVATGINTATSANADGLYSTPNLLPGDYEVTVSASGFKTEVRSGINLTVGAQQVLNITLQVGQSTQRVEVTGAATTVQLASSSISAVVTSNTVVELPLNGRDWTLLGTLEPGVNPVLTQVGVVSQANRGNRGYGAEMVVSGTRPDLNNYRLDGISIVDYAGGSPGNVVGFAAGLDSIEEFSVSTANHSAEYGRTAGGVINAITRSGTNQIHGDAFWFLRDEDFDARNFFDSKLAPFHRNQFGGSVGGPIQKDKTFFFADYELFRQDLGVTNVNKVPSADARNGILHNAGGTTTVITIDPSVKPFLGLWAMPNAGLIGTGNTGLFDVATSELGRDSFFTNRIDRKVSDKDSIFGTWFYDSGLASVPDTLDTVLIGNNSTRQLIALEETHIFSPALVNSLRGGYNRVVTVTTNVLRGINPLASDTSLGYFPGRTAPQIQVSGLTTFGGGIGGHTLQTHFWNSFQAYDDAFLTKGVHSLKFGFAFERMEHNFLSLGRNDGLFKFGSLQNFLTNQPNNFSATVPGHVSPLGVRQSIIGGYLQDDWRARANLTLNLGLRYEMATVPTEVQNKLANLLTVTSPSPHLGSPYFNNPTLRNFEPRVGFSWDPSHNGKTAVRGGFGIFDVLPLDNEFMNAQTNAAPFNESASIAPLAPGSFPTGVGDPTTFADPTKLLVFSAQFNPPRNYVLIWNLNVQRQLTPSTTITAGYVGNHGVHMLNRADDGNDVVPTSTAQGLLWPSPRASGIRVNPAVGAIRIVDWGGDSFFDALELGVTKRMSHGFQVQGSYTWGKNIDTGSATNIGDPFTNSISSLFWFCKSCRRGLSDYNVAQTFVANYIWDVPTPKKWGAIGSRVLGGWELGGIVTAQTGLPMTPLIGGDPLGLNNSDPFAFPNRLSGPGCSSDVNPGNPNNYIKVNCFAAPNPLTLLGNSGRNSVAGPGLATYDSSLFKNNYIKRISENFNAQFRAEFFNILNRANFGTPVDNGTLFSQGGAPVGGAGALDNTSTTARQIQFALKLIW